MPTLRRAQIHPGSLSFQPRSVALETLPAFPTFLAVVIGKDLRYERLSFLLKELF